MVVVVRGPPSQSDSSEPSLQSGSPPSQMYDALMHWSKDLQGTRPSRQRNVWVVVVAVAVLIVAVVAVVVLDVGVVAVVAVDASVIEVVSGSALPPDS